MLKIVVQPNTFFLWTESSEEQHLFENFCNNVEVFTVTFDKCSFAE